jgi:hypothetical protein
MKSMQFPFALGFALILCLSLAMARDPDVHYSQSYTIIIKGETAGTETVMEKYGHAGELISTSEHEISLTDKLETKRMTFSTKMVLSKASFTPISYDYRYTTGEFGDSYNVAVKDGQITRTLNKAGMKSESAIPFLPNMVILDYNVYHQYDYLIRKYDDKKKGPQVFADFIPLIGNDIKLVVTFLGDEKLEFNKSALPIKKYSVEFPGILSGTLSMDKSGRLVRLVVPAQDLQVVRKDLFLAESH